MTGSFRYDAYGDLTDSTYMDSATGLVQSNVGGEDDQGRPVIMNDTDNGQSNTETDAYNSVGDLQSESFGSAGDTAVNYAYYPANTAAGSNGGDSDALESLTASTPGGQSVSQSYSYDSAGRLASITVNGITINYSYAPDSDQVETIGASPTGANLGGDFADETYSPDSADGSRLSSISVGAGNSQIEGEVYDAGYGYNNDDQIASDQISQTDSGGNTTTQSLNYTYDPNQADALTQVTDGSGNVLYNYGYDGTGNFTGNSTLGTANNVDEYSDFTYNARHDLTNDGTYAYGYDALDRLISITPDSPTSGMLSARYGYDDQGRMLWENVYGYTGSNWGLYASYHYVWSGDELIEKLDGNNNVLQQYTWGPSWNGQDQVIALTDYTQGSPTTYLLAYDASGNVTMLLNPAGGTVVATYTYTYTYTPYGALVSATGPAAGINPFLGKGYWTDAAVDPNLGFAQPDTTDGTTRETNFSTGLWLQDDPTGFSGGLNPTSVDGNDPVNFGDPKGTTPVAEAPPVVRPSPVSQGPLWTPDPPIGTQAARAFLQGQVVTSVAQAFIGAPGHQPNSEFALDFWEKRLALDVQSGSLDANQANALIQSFQLNASGTPVPTLQFGPPGVSNGKLAFELLQASTGQPVQVLAPAPTAAWLAQYAAAKATRKAAAKGNGNGAPPTTGPATQPSTQPSRNIVDISSAGLTADETTDLREYVRRTNAWLIANGGAVVKSTQGPLRAAASVAAQQERQRARDAGTPYLPYPQAQVGHVPDTALSGQAVPPGGWLQMRGKSNSVVGGVLGPRVGQRIDGFTVDGSLP